MGELEICLQRKWKKTYDKDHRPFLPNGPISCIARVVYPILFVVFDFFFLYKSYRSAFRLAIGGRTRVQIVERQYEKL